MKGEVLLPVIAGLAAGIGFILLFSIQPLLGYPLLSDSAFGLQQDADYTPLLQLRITGLRDTYKVGEGVDFAVGQIAGGACTFPELVMIKETNTGNVVREWDGARESAALLRCPIGEDPAAGMTWSTKRLENPIIINQTGDYAVVAKHLFKTVQKDFKVVAIGEDGEDTSPEVAANLLAKSNELQTVNALLEKYPSSNVTVSANYLSRIFEAFQKYDPSGIVQYSVTNTEPLPSQSMGESDDSRTLAVTVIFDRYHNNDSPLIVVQCTGENYSSLTINEVYVAPSKIEEC